MAKARKRSAETTEEPIQEESKIKKADLPPVEKLPPLPKQSFGSRLFRVFVKGKERYLTRPTIIVASRDKSLNLQIPEDTDFELPNVRKCKDC